MPYKNPHSEAAIASQSRRNATYYKKHRDKIIAYKKENYGGWYERNGDNIRKSSSNNYWKVKGSLTKRLVIIKGQAKKRGKEFNLTKEYSEPFFKAPCYYCGDTTESLNLDRMDNSLGYVVGNIVSCCVFCNRMKSTMTLDEFKIHLKKVIKRLELS